MLALGLVTRVAHAGTWTPPPLNGHVIDTAHALTSSQVLTLDHKLDAVRQQNGFAIVVLVLQQLPDGMSIDDVGYTAGNTWGVGSAKGDDGVILIATISDRHLRIETGRGVGGGLTDVASSHINKEVIGPLMKQGRVYDAMDQGTDAIVRELAANTEGGKSDPGRAPAKKAAQKPATLHDYVTAGVIILVVIGIIILAIISPTFRSILFFFLAFGGSNRRDSGGWGGGGGGGGDGGSGYGGGGGSFGGGGSSDDY